MYTPEELNNLSPREAEIELAKSKLELYKLRLSHSNNQLKETQKLKLHRKYVARLLTMKKYIKTEAAPKSPKS